MRFKVALLIFSIMGLLLYIGYIRGRNLAYRTPEQFSAKLAKANDHSDMASKLRTAERGDLLELKGKYLFGPYRWIRANDKGWVSLSSCIADEGAEQINKLSVYTEDVIKQESPKFVDAAKIFLRCEAAMP